ncbi:CadD family cadmium resistance transporter [Alkalibacterium psychrotolerans]
MGGVILSALLSYIGTSIDHIIVLILLFNQTQHRKRDDLSIISAVFVGFTLIVLISLAARFGLSLFEPDWIGLLGLIPIGLGIRVLFKPVDDEQEAQEKISHSFSRHRSQFISVFFLMLAFGGDNLGVYIPLFASLDWVGITVTLLIYYALTGIMLAAAYKISEVKQINQFIEKYERWLVSFVFILLGLFILFENRIGW